jgi:hypothetical protein
MRFANKFLDSIKVDVYHTSYPIQGGFVKQFNINGYVHVKLTDYGRKIHKERDDEFRKRFPMCRTIYIPPEEEKDGWSKWQMWDLMETFGEHCGLCKELPFDTTIRFEERQ